MNVSKIAIAVVIIQRTFRWPPIWFDKRIYVMHKDTQGEERKIEEKERPRLDHVCCTNPESN